MKMIKTISKSMSYSFYKSDIISKDEIEIYEYGMELILALVLNIVLVLSVGIILGVPVETIIFLGTYSTLRKNTGGIHAGNHFRCVGSFLVLYSIFVLGYKLFPINIYMMLGLYIVSVISILVLSPLDDGTREVDDEGKYKKRIRLLLTIHSIIILVSIFYQVYINICMFEMYGVVLCSILLILGVIKKNMKEDKHEQTNS